MLITATTSFASERHQFQQVTITILKIDPASAVAVVEFHVLMTLGTAAIDDAFGLDAAKNGIELGVRDVESVVMVPELTRVVEVERQPFVHSDRREMPVWPIVVESEDVSEEPRRFILVVRRNDGVLQLNGHVNPCWSGPEFTKGLRLPIYSVLNKTKF